jgi:hypothetical protein
VRSPLRRDVVAQAPTWAAQRPGFQAPAFDQCARRRSLPSSLPGLVRPRVTRSAPASLTTTRRPFMPNRCRRNTHSRPNRRSRGRIRCSLTLHRSAAVEPVTNASRAIHANTASSRACSRTTRRPASSSRSADAEREVEFPRFAGQRWAFGF